MAEEREPRKRIPYKKNMEPDTEQFFIKNKSSENARKIGANIESIDIDCWIDKHYHTRSQHGDGLGKREGIGQEKVHSFVIGCVRHLIFYASTVKNYIFLNHDNAPRHERKIRVVCQKEYPEGRLNVVIQVHSNRVNHYEITIITAMQNDDFNLSDGQYVIELLGGDNSVLYIFSKKGGKLTEVSNI